MCAITPAILGAGAPLGSDLAGYSASRYARFSREFEHAATEEICRHDAADSLVLANDISEGPDFRLLASRGYRLFTIFHVDVVEYVTALYFRGLVAPETTVRWYGRLHRVLPSMAKLVWKKQQACVEASKGLIVPSPRMRDVLLRCYPNCAPEKIHVLPWGNWHSTEPADPQEVVALQTEFGIPLDTQVLLTLSRISPEKGQDILLESLIEWERRNGPPARPVVLLICGAAAFMQGRRHMEKLRSLAARLRYIRVVFPGHVTGTQKRALFGLADLYVFPSRHESYGLTLMEAMACGLPAVCLDTHGARSVVRQDTGKIVPARLLATTAMGLLADTRRRAAMSAAARAAAEADRFSDRAKLLSGILGAS